MKRFEPTMVGKPSFLTASDFVHGNLREAHNRLEQVNKKAQKLGIIDRKIGSVGHALHGLTKRPDCSAKQSRLESPSPPLGRSTMSISTILLILLVLLLIGALPSWPYSTGWGYYPSGGLGLVLLVLLVLIVTGRL
jgi:hypothetical protein